MTEKIGLSAILDLSNFSAGLAKYTGGVKLMTKETSSVAASITSDFVGIGQGVLKFGAIAGGAALVGIGALGAGLVVLGGQALEEYAKFERLSLSITNLVARELSQGQQVEQQRQVMAQLTKAEADELQNLNLKIQEEGLERQTQLARIQEQKQRIIELTAAYGENGLNVQTAKAKLAEMEFELTKSDAAAAGMTARINELNAKNGQMVTVLDKVRVGQMSMTDAMLQAAPKAQELLKWIQLLAIQSPFNQEGIADAFRTAMAYGFTTEQAKRLTAAEVDFAAATGKGVEATNLIALALGQIQAKGKVSGQEIIQLTNAGIGVNKILEDMGFTLDDVSKGLVDSDKFIEAVIVDMEVFKGAGKAQSETFSGLISSLEDLKSIGLRELFTGTFQAIQPYLATFVSGLTDAALLSGKLRAIGDVIGNYVGKGIKTAIDFAIRFKTTILGLIDTFKAGGLFGSRSGSFGSAGLLAALGLSTDTVGQIENLFNRITGAYEAFIAGGLFGSRSGSFGGTGLLSFLGISPETQATIQTVFDAISSGVQTVTAFLSQLSFNEILGGLTGIGAVLAAGVFAALVAAVLSLLSPINLIIAGAALLGAAWAGNWGDIQGKTMAAWAVIQPVLTDLWNWLQVNIPLAIQTLSSFWQTTLLPAMAAAGVFITTTVIPALTNLYTWLQVNLPAAITAVSAFWTGTLQPALATVTGFITGTVAPVLTALAGEYITQVVGRTQVLIDTWNLLLVPLTIVSNYISSTLTPFLLALGNVISAIVNKAVEAGAGLWQNVLHPALVAVGDYLSAKLQPFFQTIGDYLSGTFAPIASDLGSFILPAIAAGFVGISTAIQAATTWLNSLATSINALALPAWLTPGSPTPFEMALQGIAAVLQGDIITAMGIFGTTITTSFTEASVATTAWATEITGIAAITLPELGAAGTAAAKLLVAKLLLIGKNTTLLNQSIQAIYLVTLPTLTRIVTATVELLIEQIDQVQQSVITWDQTIQAIYLATLPALQIAGTSAFQTITTAILSAIPAINTLINAIKQVPSAFRSLEGAGTSAAEEIASNMGKASSGVKNLTESVRASTAAFQAMAAAAREAATQATAAGRAAGRSSGTGFSQGVGFQAGIGLAGGLIPAGGQLGLGVTVPPGYPNDSFGPLYVESGEQLLVTPRGLSIESLIKQRLAGMGMGLAQGTIGGQRMIAAPVSTTNYYFDMTVNTGASAESVVQQFSVMKAMTG